MVGSGGQLSYNIYLDAARTMVWGDGTGGSSYYSATGTGNAAPVSVIMYGGIPTQQNVGAGTYTDILVVTINF